MPRPAGTRCPSASTCPADRLGPALELLAEVVRRPTFPEAEVERLRDERLNDLLQAKADPRRRADEAFVATIYAPLEPVPPAVGAAPTTTVRASTSPSSARSMRGPPVPSRAAIVVARRRRRRRA